MESRPTGFWPAERFAFLVLMGRLARFVRMLCDRSRGGVSRAEWLLWGIVLIQAWLFYFSLMCYGNFHMPPEEDLIIPSGVISQEQEVGQSAISQLGRGVDVGKYITTVSLFTCLLTGGLTMAAAVSVRGQRLRAGTKGEV